MTTLPHSIPTNLTDLDHRTMASQLTDMIRLDIIRGVLKPNTKLRLSSLAERYGCGVIPIREALSRLSTGGFVQIVDQRGFKVAPVHPKELMDVLSLRIKLESMALRSSIGLGDIAWEEQIVASHHRLSRYCAVNESGELDADWEQAHKSFHIALVSACGSPWLLHFIDILFDQATRLRYLSMSTAPRTTRNVAKEHEDLVDATLKKDADLAVEILVEHFQRTSDLAMLALNKQ